MATKSVAESAQFRMLPEQAQQDILADIAANGIKNPSLNMRVGNTAVAGPVFKDDMPEYGGTVGPLTKTQAIDIIRPEASQDVQVAGPLSAVTMPQRELPDIAEMLQRFVPQDDSQSRYLALAAGFGAPTKTGSFAETIGNVASAMNEQKMQQAKLRSQYAPLIMQQVAAQQAREEQQMYRLEAQRAQQQAAQLLAQQNQQAALERARENQAALDERAKRDEALRRELAADRAATSVGAPTFITAADGTQMMVDRSGNAKPVLGLDGKPVLTKDKSPMSASLQKELMESDDIVNSSKTVKTLLNEALTLNDTAYSGYGAKTRAVIRSNLPGQSGDADATINLDNIMGGQALESLKSTFGAAPTEGERKILLDLQASAEKTPVQRKAIIDRAIAAADRRKQYASLKAAAIRDGTYLTKGIPEFSDAFGGGDKPPVGAPTMPGQDAIAAEIAKRAAAKKGS